MAPLKFEDSIKEKLEKRTIRPSNGSWEKLDDQLGQKKAKKYWWLGIAASIAGFLIITTFFVNSQKEKESFDTEFVDVNKIIKKKESIDVVEIKKEKPNIDIEENIKETENQNIPNAIVQNSKKSWDDAEKNTDAKKVILKEHKAIIKKSPIKENIKEAVAVQVDTFTKNTIEEDASFLITEDVIQSKVANIEAKVKELEKNSDVITDEEVNALLREAQLEITTQQILKSNKVNASALLLDVESELDESFKDRVFEALKTGFEKLKTTVAERDN